MVSAAAFAYVNCVILKASRAPYLKCKTPNEPSPLDPVQPQSRRAPKDAGGHVLVAVVPLSVALLASSLVLEDREEANAKERLANIADLSSAEVQRWLFIGRQELTALAASSPTNRKDFPPELKEEIFRILKQNFKTFEHVYILDLQGNILASEPKPPPIQQWRDLEVYTSTVSGQPSLSQAIYDPQAKTASYIFTVPVLENGRQWGVLAATLVDSPQEQFATGIQTEDNFAFVIEGNGLIIGHSDREKLGEIWTTGKELYMEDIQKARWVTDQGKRLLCVQRPIVISGKVGTPWRAVACSSESNVFSALPSARGVIRFSLLGSLALAIVTGTLLSRGITEPLKKLARSAKQIQSGRLDHRAEVIGGDEIADLAVSFNKMTDTLKSQIEEIRREREMLDAIQSSMVEGLAIIDESARVLYVNNAALTIFGLKASQIIGQPLDAIIDRSRSAFEPKNAEALLFDAVHGRKPLPVQLEVTVLRPERKSIVISIFDIFSELLPKSRGLLFRDVTEERDLVRRRDEFVSVASHELRTPLTTIIAFTELLLDSEDKGKVPSEWVERMRADAQRLAAIVDDLLDVSRLRAGKIVMRLQQVSVVDAVREAIATSHATDESHPVSINIPDNLPTVLADKSKFGQVLTNLLQNAVKYSPTGRNVTVSAQSHPDTKHVVIAVSDQGIGIAPEDQKTLFTPFHRVQRSETVGIRGTGLGLYIVKEYVTLMNGEVWVESELNKGSTFYIALPTEDPNLEQPV